MLVSAEGGSAECCVSAGEGVFPEPRCPARPEGLGASTHPPLPHGLPGSPTGSRGLQPRTAVRDLRSAEGTRQDPNRGRRPPSHTPGPLGASRLGPDRGPRPSTPARLPLSPSPPGEGSPAPAPPRRARTERGEAEESGPPGQAPDPRPRVAALTGLPAAPEGGDGAAAAAGGGAGAAAAAAGTAAG